MEYCPDCITTMKKESKKLGKLSSWLVCPKCGYRTREDSNYYKLKEVLEASERIAKINKSNEFTE